MAGEEKTVKQSREPYEQESDDEGYTVGIQSVQIR